MQRGETERNGFHEKSADNIIIGVTLIRGVKLQAGVACHKENQPNFGTVHD